MKRTARDSLNGDTAVYYTYCKDLKELRRIKHYYSAWSDVKCTLVGGKIMAAVINTADNNKRKEVRLG
jgi:hypothetical protein